MAESRILRGLPLAQARVRLPARGAPLAVPTSQAASHDAAPSSAPTGEALEAARAAGDAAGRQAVETVLRTQFEAAVAAIQATAQAERESNDSLRDRLGTLLEQLGAIAAAHARSMEATAIEIAHGAVLGMLGKAATEQRLVAELVRAALADVDCANGVTVRLHPRDAELVGVAQGQRALPSTVRIVADETLEPASCVIANSRGAIDASLERQLAGFRRALHDAYGPEAVHGA